MLQLFYSNYSKLREHVLRLTDVVVMNDIYTLVTSDTDISSYTRLMIYVSDTSSSEIDDYLKQSNWIDNITELVIVFCGINFDQIPSSLSTVNKITLNNSHITNLDNIDTTKITEFTLIDNNTIFEFPKTPCSNLQLLSLKYNPRITSIDINLDGNTSMQHLIIENNDNLQYLPISFGNMSSLKTIRIRNNINLNMPVDLFFPSFQSMVDSREHHILRDFQIMGNNTQYILNKKQFDFFMPYLRNRTYNDVSQFIDKSTSFAGEYADYIIKATRTDLVKKDDMRNIKNMTSEIVYHILSYLDHTSVSQFAATNKYNSRLIYPMTIQIANTLVSMDNEQERIKYINKLILNNPRITETALNDMVLNNPKLSRKDLTNVEKLLNDVGSKPNDASPSPPKLLHSNSLPNLRTTLSRRKRRLNTKSAGGKRKKNVKRTRKQKK